MVLKKNYNLIILTFLWHLNLTDDSCTTSWLFFCFVLFVFYSIWAATIDTSEGQHPHVFLSHLSKLVGTALSLASVWRSLSPIRKLLNTHKLSGSFWWNSLVSSITLGSVRLYFAFDQNKSYVWKLRMSLICFWASNWRTWPHKFGGDHSDWLWDCVWLRRAGVLWRRLFSDNCRCAWNKR